LGRTLGKGGFSIVNEIRTINLTKNLPSKERLDVVKSMNDHPIVIKTPRNDLPESEQTKSIKDLSIESNILQKLNHVNIIKLWGISNQQNFIVLELLQETLENQIEHWRRAVHQARGLWWCCFGYCFKSSHTLEKLLLERLYVAFGIASAIAYLHDHKIIYRDLKPDNVGFDAAGQVKLFDFGLAKVLKGNYKLTGNTGSLRYMAPEVCLCLDYNVKADSYSFGILLWQLCALSTPFAGYTCKMHAKLVVQQHHRPQLLPNWPASWKSLMSSCWDAEYSKRPNFNKIVQQLDEEIRLHAQCNATTRLPKNKATTDLQMDIDTRLTHIIHSKTKEVQQIVRKHDNQVI